MRVLVLGCAGRTGRRLVDHAVLRRHQVVGVDCRAVNDGQVGASLVVGDARDRDVLQGLVRGVDAVLSAIGPTNGEPQNAAVARVLVEAMTSERVERFVGVSGADVRLPADRRTWKHRLVSLVVHGLEGQVVDDLAREHRQWLQSEIAWTLVRPTRLTDDRPTGRVIDHATITPGPVSTTRSDLASFLLTCAERSLHVREAPFVASGATTSHPRVPVRGRL